MEIIVSGSRSIRRQLAKNSADFFLRELNLARSRMNVQIDLITGLLKNAGQRGGVIQIEKDFLSMAVDSKLDVETFISTIAHEMIHVKQYALGHLRYDHEGNAYWLGKHYRPGHYYDSPWEQEAFRRERLLANKLLKTIFS